MLRLSFLGTLKVTLNEEPIDGFVSSKAALLLAYLVLTEKAHTRHALAGLFWPDDTEQKAKNSLRVALSNLNKLLPGYLHGDRLVVSFVQDEPNWLDTAVFTDHLDQTSYDHLEAAADFYRGDLLANLDSSFSTQLTEWLFAQRTHWRQQALALFDKLATHHLAQHSFPSAIHTLQRLLEIDPWQETAHRRLMLALARTNQLAAALQQFETCRQQLAEAFGVEPMAQTAVLYERILLATQSPNLPIPQSSNSLIGRQPELATLLNWLTQPACRLVSLIGLGGMGKTHMALAVAGQVNSVEHRRFLNGVTFVPLLPIMPDEHAIENIVQAIAQALDIILPNQQMATVQLIDHLQAEERLLVLDNIEHLLGQAGWLGELLAACPHLKLLVTSREALNLGSEWRFELSGLPVVPALETPNELPPATALFVETAAFTPTTPQLEDIQAVCELVSGVPLAVKLAAFGLKDQSIRRLLSAVRQNLGQLRAVKPDLPSRQQSMAAILDTAWMMLTSTAQETLMRLTQFRGGFTTEAARVVANASLLVLLELGDYGLLPSLGKNGRYQLHELVRQYAQQQRKKTTVDDQIATAHAAYYAQLLANQQPNLQGTAVGRTMQLLEHEQNNMRQAWRHLLHGQSFALLDQMADGLGLFLHTRASNLEGSQLFGEAVRQLQPHGKQPKLQAKLLGWQAKFIYQQGFAAQADALFVHQREMAQAVGDVRQEAEAELGLALVANRNSQADRVQRHASVAHTLFEQIQDKAGMISALHQLGIVHHIREEQIAAIGIYEQVMKTAVLFSMESAALSSRINIGYILANRGEYKEAAVQLRQAEQLLEQAAFSFERGRLFYHLGRVNFFLGDYAKAQHYFEQSRAAQLRSGNRHGILSAERWLGRVAGVQGDFGTARRWLRHSLQLARQLEVDTSIALGLSYSGMVEEWAGHFGEAAAHFAESLALMRSLNRWREDIVGNLDDLARVSVKAGEPAAAQGYLAEAVTLAQGTPDEQANLSLLVTVAMWLMAEKRPLLVERLLQTVLADDRITAVLRQRAKQLLVQVNEETATSTSPSQAAFSSLAGALEATIALFG